MREYLPEFRLFDAVATERVTVRDLLCDHWIHAPGDLSTTQILAVLHHLEPSHDFRDTYLTERLLQPLPLASIPSCSLQDTKFVMFTVVPVMTAIVALPSVRLVADAPSRASVPFKLMLVVPPANVTLEFPIPPSIWVCTPFALAVVELFVIDEPFTVTVASAERAVARKLDPELDVNSDPANTSMTAIPR